MAQQTTSRKRTSANGNGLFKLNERVVGYGREASLNLVEAYESSFKRIADYQDRVADLAPVDWIGTLGHTQADFTRQLTDVYASTARKALK